MEDRSTKIQKNTKEVEMFEAMEVNFPESRKDERHHTENSH